MPSWLVYRVLIPAKLKKSIWISLFLDALEVFRRDKADSAGRIFSC